MEMSISSDSVTPRYLLWLCCILTWPMADSLEDSSTTSTVTSEFVESYLTTGSIQSQNAEEFYSGNQGFNQSSSGKLPPETYREGPLPTISDSLFSLIILIYVSVIFIFMFFSFCWKEPEPPPPDPAHKNIPMITSMLEEMEKQLAEKQLKEEAGMNGGARNGSGPADDEGTEMTEILVRKSDADVIVNVVQEKSKGMATSTIKEEAEEEEAATQV